MFPRLLIIRTRMAITTEKLAVQGRKKGRLRGGLLFLINYCSIG